MGETRQGLINYLEVIADQVKMHPKATAAIRQATSIIRSITGDEFKEIEYKPTAPMTLNELARAIHQNAVDHGWWDKEVSLGDTIANVHAELSEALEEYREGNPMVYGTCAIRGEDCEHWQKCDFGDPRECKPEGIAVELADAVIRILDFTAAKGIDIEAIIMAKHEYNKTRPYRHGGKVV